MAFPLKCRVMVAPELLQQRYILSFVFASNLSLSRLYITMCLILRTTRAKPPHHSCGASTRYVRSINTTTQSDIKKVSVMSLRISQILDNIDELNLFLISQQAVYSFSTNEQVLRSYNSFGILSHSHTVLDLHSACMEDLHKDSNS